MRPVLFHKWGLKIHSYQAMLYIGLVAGIVTGNAAAHATGVDAFQVFVANFILIVPAMIGARLFHVASYLRSYRQNLGRIWNRNEGGAAQYGGLALVLPCSVPLLAALRMPLGAYWDVAVFMILVAMIFGRIGCLMNGCCAGRPSKAWFAVHLPNHRGEWEKRIPSQCFEAGLAALLLLAAIFLRRSLPFPGALFLIVTGGYACGRLLLESTREPLPGTRGFNIYHGISVVAIVLVVAVLASRWPR